MTVRARTLQQWLLRAALSLVLGVATTIGIAWWACIAFGDLPPRRGVAVLISEGDDEFFGALWLDRGRCLSLRTFHFQGMTDSTPEPSIIRGGGWSVAGLEACIDETQRLRRLDPPTPYSQTPIARLLRRGGWGPKIRQGEWIESTAAAGWPKRALWSRPEDYRNGTGTFETPLKDVYGNPIRLPYWIAWPGFVMNTLLYAAASWMLLAIPGMVQRLVRRRRGACLACGYDLRGLATGESGAVVCPECGG